MGVGEQGLTPYMQCNPNPNLVDVTCVLQVFKSSSICTPCSFPFFKLRELSQSSSLSSVCKPHAALMCGTSHASALLHLYLCDVRVSTLYPTILAVV